MESQAPITEYTPIIDREAAYAAGAIVALSDPLESPGSIREAVGIFETVIDLQDCIRELEGSAFPRHAISVMRYQDDVENVFVMDTLHPEQQMDDPAAPRQAPVRPEEQTIGASALIGGSAYLGAMALALSAGAVAAPVIAGITGAAIIGGIGGGTVGAILSKLLGDNFSHQDQAQIERGGLLLWVRTPDTEREDLALQIMKKYHGHNVHIHETT